MSEIGKLKFECHFLDDVGNPIVCAETDCSVGSYMEIEYESPTSKVVRSTGACATCGFCGDIIDIFNPDSSRYIPDAPDCYKNVAVRVLTETENGVRNLEMLRSVAPTTVEIIEGFSSIP